MRLAIYGAGEECRRYVELKSNEDIQIVLIVDSNCEKWGRKICGCEIGKPSDLNCIAWDKILISPRNKKIQSEIREMLKINYLISEDKLVSVYDLITDSKSQNALRKIYDCFTFYNELDLLKMRLRLLNPIVDYFVIVEMELTQRGAEKPFYFEEHKDLYKDYMDKIIHVKITKEMIPQMGENMRTSLRGVVHDWTLEIFQRNCINLGLKECDSEDIVMISDLDEIPDPNILKQLTDIDEKFEKSMLLQLLQAGPVTLENDFYMGYINCKVDKKWLGSVVTLKKFLIKPDEMRSYRDTFPQLEKAGWHLSWMGATKEKILQKQYAVCEGTEHNNQSLEMVVSNILQGRAMPTNSAYGKIISLTEVDFPYAGELYRNEREKWFIEEK